MEDSLSSSISSSGSDISAMACHQASKYFVNKRFLESYETLEPLLKANSLRLSGQITDKTWHKCWKLFIALVDTAAHQGPLVINGSGAIWPKKVRKQLLSQVNSGALIEQAKQAFPFETLPLDIAVALVNVSVKYNGNLVIISQFIEEYLAVISSTAFDYSPEQVDDYEKLLHLFIYKVLPARQEFDYAREFIRQNDFFNPGKKLDMLHKIDSLETLHNVQVENEKHKEQDHKILEAERVANAEAKDLADSITESSSSDGSSLVTAPGKSPRVSDNSSLPVSSPPQSSSTSTPLSSSRSPVPSTSRIQDWSSLKRYWTQKALTLNTSNLISILLFFITAILTFSNPVTRNRLRNMVSIVWAKIIATFSMAFKVSYI